MSRFILILIDSLVWLISILGLCLSKSKISAPAARRESHRLRENHIKEAKKLQRAHEEIQKDRHEIDLW